MLVKRKSPQEKKALSYAKDRRNTYGENDKSSRKNIPRNDSRSQGPACKQGSRAGLRAVGNRLAAPVDE